jgi:uncharacterized membrane protein YhdT
LKIHYSFSWACHLYISWATLIEFMHLSYLLNIHFNFKLLYTLRPSKWFLSLLFPYMKSFLHLSYLKYISSATNIYPSWFDNQKIIIPSYPWHSTIV